MISFRQTAQGYEGHVIVETRWGPVVVHATAPTGWVEEALARLASQRPDLVSGDFFADAKKAFTDAAKSQVFRDVTKVTSEVAKNPYLQSAVSLYSPAAGQALKGIGDASTFANQMAQRAAAGDPKARADVAAITQRAAQGDKRAQTAAKLIREKLRAEQAKRVRPGVATREQTRAAIAAKHGQPAPAVAPQPQCAAPAYYPAPQPQYAAPAYYPAPLPAYDPYGAADYVYSPEVAQVPYDEYRAAFPAEPQAAEFYPGL